MALIGGPGPEPGGMAWAGESAVRAGVVAALLSMVFLHVTGIGLVDPLGQTISDYVFVPMGYPVLGVAAFGLAAATVVLALGLRSAGLPNPGRPIRLLFSVGGALVLVAVFPTHETGTVPGLVSTVHRLAGGWVFVALPLAGWLIARRAATAPGWTSTAPLLTLSAGATGMLSIGFLLSHIPIVIAGSPGFSLLGGVERVLYAAVMLVILTTARATRIGTEHGLSNVSVPAAAPDSDLRGAA